MTSSQTALCAALEDRFGLRNLKPDWVRRQTEFSADVLTGPICRTDICEITKGTLPWSIISAHSVQLDTKVLVQIEDVINIASADPRSMDAPRVLQFSLTDGSIDFIALELEPLSSRISMRTVPGTKLVLHPSALVRRGRVMLTEKDYTFLGSPPTNIWGTSYSQKVSEALTAARLQNPNASSFDSIARSTTTAAGTAASGNLPIQNLPDMGGIADAVPSANNEESDGDQFWAQAAAFADRSEAQGVGSSTGPASNNRSNPHFQTRPTASMRREEQQTRPSVPPSTENVPARVTNALQIEDTRQRHAAGRANVVPEVIEIPDMPVYESDPAVNDTGECDMDPMEDAEFLDMEESVIFAIPELPLSQFEEVSTLCSSGVKRSVFRAFVSKPRSKLRIDRERNELSLSAQFDDGSAIVSLVLRQRFLARLSHVSLPSIESLPWDSSSFQDSSSEESISDQVRKACRGIAAFIHVEHEQDVSSVIHVGMDPPNGFVSTPHYVFLSIFNLPCKQYSNS